MAKRPQRKHRDSVDIEEKQGDLQALREHIKENPVLYVISIVFIVVCAGLGGVYRIHTGNVNRELTTQYARALDLEDPDARAEALASLSQGDSPLTAEALYMQGEAAYDAKKHKVAAAAFERLRQEFPEFPHTPDAVEGLGYVEEDQANYAAALAKYREVLDKWPDSFAGRRQPLNVGRCQERTGNLEAAVLAYRDQLEIFPGSSVAQRAQNALNRLRRTNPELFPKESLGLDGDEAPLTLAPLSGATEDTVLTIDAAVPGIQVTVDEDAGATTTESAPDDDTGVTTAPPTEAANP